MKEIFSTGAGGALAARLRTLAPSMTRSTRRVAEAVAVDPAGCAKLTVTALGDAANTRYGVAQVRVTVSGGRITKVEAVQLQNGDPKSSEISAYAEPILQQSVLSKQTAAVDTVSGATYTSLSYEASLQAALDKLGFKSADGSTASTDTSQLQ